MKSFLSDLLSPAELNRAELRWVIAQTQMEISCSAREARRRHDASQELVRRVFKAVQRAESGYRLAYARLRNPADVRSDSEGPRLNPC
jgi:uncharacterized protein YerC